MAGYEAVWVHNATACKFAPVESAAGAHSTYRRGQGGKITGYQEWWPNANNPKSGFQSGRRFRGDGKPHSGMEPPLVYPKGRGKARFPEPWELPRGY